MSLLLTSYSSSETAEPKDCCTDDDAPRCSGEDGSGSCCKMGEAISGLSSSFGLSTGGEGGGRTSGCCGSTSAAGGELLPARQGTCAATCNRNMGVCIRSGPCAVKQGCVALRVGWLIWFKPGMDSGTPLPILSKAGNQLN